MEKSALILLTLAALIGAAMLSYLLRGKRIPKGMAFVHGPLAVGGIILLIIYALDDAAHDRAWESVLLFAAAATGGLALFIKDLTGKKLPVWLAILHGLLALSGIAMIASDVF